LEFIEFVSEMDLFYSWQCCELTDKRAELMFYCFLLASYTFEIRTRIKKCSNRLFCPYNPKNKRFKEEEKIYYYSLKNLQPQQTFFT